MGPRAARVELAWILTAVSFGLESHTLVRSLPTAPQNTGPKIALTSRWFIFFKALWLWNYKEHLTLVMQGFLPLFSLS